MPRKSKVSPEQRKKWLKQHSEGVPQDEIAAADRVVRRTVREGIERARVEADFEVAQREQLREALRGHQQDLLRQIGRIQDVTTVPAPDYRVYGKPEKWLEDSDQEGAVSGSTALNEPMPASLRPGEGAPQVNVIQNADGPQTVSLSDEGSALWTALKAHTGAKDPLWKAIGNWTRVRLRQEKSRWELTMAIKNLAKEEIHLPVLGASSDQPRITPQLIALARQTVMQDAFGQPYIDPSGELEWQGSNLVHTRHGVTLVVRSMADDVTIGQVKVVMRAATDLTEPRAEAEEYRALESATDKVHGECEQYRLMHFVAGRCSICKRLGGQ